METIGRNAKKVDILEFATNYYHIEEGMKLPQGDAGQLLRNARNLVSKGWLQGKYSDRDEDTVCSLGAISKARRSLNTSTITLWVATDVLEMALKELGYSEIRVNEWNDAPDRTQESVLAAFDRAGVIWEKLTDDERDALAHKHEQIAKNYLEKSKETIERVNVIDLTNGISIVSIGEMLKKMD